ncbi:hypothetical protein GCM10010486_82950 [Nonomuraea roseoviolacea subsp. carminata]
MVQLRAGSKWSKSLTARTVSVPPFVTAEDAPDFGAAAFPPPPQAAADRSTAIASKPIFFDMATPCGRRTV